MITNKDRINKIEEEDLEIWMNALSIVILEISNSPRPVYPEDPTESSIKDYNIKVAIDSYRRKTAREMAPMIPEVIQHYIWLIVNSGKFQIIGIDNQQIWKPDDGRQDLPYAISVFRDLFKLISTPPETLR